MKVLLVALLFLSCVSEPELTHWPSRTVSYTIKDVSGLNLPNARNIIQRAFKEWEGTGAVRFVEVEDGQITVDLRPYKGKWAGFSYFPPDGRVYLDSSERTWNDDLLYRVTLHEIGHALGLRHSYRTKSIMFRSIQKNGRITGHDLANIRNLYKNLTFSVNQPLLYP